MPAVACWMLAGPNPASSLADRSGFANRSPTDATMISRPFGSTRRATARDRTAMPTRLTICDSAGRGLWPPDFTVALGGNMQALLKAVVLLCVLSAGTCGYGFDLASCFGFCGGPACGCGNPNCCDGCEPAWGWDPGCGCEADCCCEPGCGCDASCGCGSYCSTNGRSFAGKKYTCGCDVYVPTNYCTGPADCCCEPSCGCCGECGECCDPACGCEPACGCDPGCGCEPACGCGTECNTNCCAQIVGACIRMCSKLCGGGSCGCDSEVYWCEWYNDPPHCCDPCDRCGNWTGPSYGPGGGPCGCDGCGDYGATYGPGYVDDGGAYYSSNRRTTTTRSTTVAARPQTKTVKATTSGPTTARRPSNPFTQPRAARTPQPSARAPQQR